VFTPKATIRVSRLALLGCTRQYFGDDWKYCWRTQLPTNSATMLPVFINLVLRQAYRWLIISLSDIMFFRYQLQRKLKYADSSLQFGFTCAGDSNAPYARYALSYLSFGNSSLIPQNYNCIYIQITLISKINLSHFKIVNVINWSILQPIVRHSFKVRMGIYVKHHTK
jgi:hypothetical protein